MAVLLGGCTTAEREEPVSDATYRDVQYAGAMKDVKRGGKLAGVISLDTIQDRVGLYGLGPESYLKGELTIYDGQIYLSHVLTDSTMTVEQVTSVQAPFFVYGNVTEWEKVELPDSVRTIRTLEVFLDAMTKDRKRPFAFRLSGTVAHALIHIQNLPEGTEVHSPRDASIGQVKYPLANVDADIVGFFSTEHQGVFTHHDSFLHMHLLSKDRKLMGHLDELEFRSESVELFLPIR